MQDYQPNVFARDDTFFGVCQALGEDFGFHPNLLRVAFALALFWNPLGALAAYAAAGLVVGLSRWLAPNPPLPRAAEPVAEAEPVDSTVEEEPAPVPLAA